MKPGEPEKEGGGDEPPNWVIRTFTPVGRALFTGAVLATMGGVGVYVLWIREDLPAGRYPILLFAVPVGIGCVLLFFGLAWLLERLGIRIYNR